MADHRHSAFGETIKDKTRVIYLLTQLILRFYFAMILKIHIYGMENVPSHNVAILVANHRSTLDVFLLMSILKRKIYTFGKADFFEFFLLGWYLRALGGIPVKNEKYNRASLENACKILADNKLLLIFPEGRVYAGSSMLPFKYSFVKLALKHHVPIIPIAISGSDKALKLGHFFPRPAEITIDINQPILLSAIPQKVSKKRNQIFAMHIQKMITEKLDKITPIFLLKT